MCEHASEKVWNEAIVRWAYSSPEYTNAYKIDNTNNFRLLIDGGCVKYTQIQYRTSYVSARKYQGWQQPVKMYRNAKNYSQFLQVWRNNF